MKYNQQWKTAYQETVEFAALAACEAVGESGHWSLRQFAENYGFKITPNLRRRLAELVGEGKLSRAQRYLDNGKLGYVYYAPPSAAHLPWDNETQGFEDRWNDAILGSY